MTRTIASKAVLAAALLATHAGYARAIGGDTPLVLSLANAQNSLSFGASFARVPANAGSAMAYPGLYSQLDTQSVAVAHSTLFQGTSYDSVSYAYPTLTGGAFGAGLFRLATPGADVRDASGAVIGSFSQSEMLVRFGYGSMLLPHLGWGTNVSILQKQLGSIKSGFSTVAVGASYNGINRLNSSLAIDNVTYKNSGAATGRLNPTLRLSNTYDLWKNKIALGMDASMNPTVDYRLGVRYALTSNLKMGVGRSNDVSGLGLEYSRGRFVFDYNIGMHDLGTTHHLNIIVSFGRSRAAARSLASRDHFEKARLYTSVGRYADARASLQDGRRFQELPLEMRRLEQGLAALADAQISEVQGTRQMQVLLRKGISLYLDNKQPLARDVFLQLRTLDPRNHMIEKLLALPGIAEGTIKDGGSELPKFTDIDPIKLKLFKTEEYFKKQQWDLALKECKEILAINPREVMAYIRLGSVLYALGMKKEAVESWKYAQALEPNHPQVIKAVQFMRQAGHESPAPEREARELQEASEENK